MLEQAINVQIFHSVRLIDGFDVLVGKVDDVVDLVQVLLSFYEFLLLGVTEDNLVASQPREVILENLVVV